MAEEDAGEQRPSRRCKTNALDAQLAFRLQEEWGRHLPEEEPARRRSERRAKKRKHDDFDDWTSSAESEILSTSSSDESSALDKAVSFVLLPLGWEPNLSHNRFSSAPDASILSVKRFLVTRLALDIPADTIQLSCRRLPLRSHLSLGQIRQHLWPSVATAPLTLRYELPPPDSTR
eukprot:CAMPEP_0175825226 /NCGR_PEP_ID=MMETSP0107_2-20121207/11139_1 /TAXON_ID=195067 ORGANISM="Goniomonas pacifica, Strain CCMP1869" /NCGR_SAMPLE_ID=MMETSP0107_2 /ASSEMBLY_ACC=CAM_ASM_000203 /LENGTH=175 /DNA_ID=CAMNT_0017137825 /DNA_START=1 /DNA_END=528 /DNA_ORIENTATION=-